MKKIIEVKNVDCLRANTDLTVIALFQPKLCLLRNEDLGPHFESSEKATIIKKIVLFLELAIQNKAQLVIFPEYGAPVEILSMICRGEISLPSDILLIMPLECIDINEYKKILETYKIKHTSGLNAGPLKNGYINVCAIIVMESGVPQIYLQAKRIASDLEKTGLYPGTDYFIFKGDGISLTTIICSDANEIGKCKTQIEDNRDAARGNYYVHVQWNPSPDHDLYDRLWDFILSGDTNDSQVLISINAARDSTLTGDSGKIVNFPYSRIACSGEGKRDDKYMTDNKLSVHKSLFKKYKYGQIYNFIYPDECASIIRIKRPHEKSSHPAASTRTFLHESLSYKYDQRFIELQKEYFLNAFEDSIRENPSIADIHACTKNLKPEDKEILLCSIIFEDKYKWLKKEILYRPVVWSSFYRYIPNTRNAEAVDYFIQSIIKSKSFLGDIYVPIIQQNIENYPLNLVNEKEGHYGWLFHCRGLTEISIAKSVATFLSRISSGNIIRLKLLAVQCPKSLTEDMISKSLIELNEPDMIGNKESDITDYRRNIASLEVIKID